MKTAYWRIRILSIFGLLAMPALALGATLGAQPGYSSAIRRVDSAQAARLLHRMHVNVARVNDEAGRLQSYYLSDLTWQRDASTIDRIAHRVKQMDIALHTLRAMQDDVTPSQAQEITRLTPQVFVLTDELNSSIRFLNQNHHYLWSPTWRMDAADMHYTSRVLERDLQGMPRDQRAPLPASRAAKFAS